MPLGQFETAASRGNILEADRRLSGENPGSGSEAALTESDRELGDMSPREDRLDYTAVCIGSGHSQPAMRRKSSTKFSLSSNRPISPRSCGSAGDLSGSDREGPSSGGGVYDHTPVCIGTNSAANPAARRKTSSRFSLQRECAAFPPAPGPPPLRSPHPCLRPVRPHRSKCAVGTARIPHHRPPPAGPAQLPRPWSSGAGRRAAAASVRACSSSRARASRRAAARAAAASSSAPPAPRPSPRRCRLSRCVTRASWRKQEARPLPH